MPAPRELHAEDVGGHRHAGRKALEGRDERGTVGLTGRQEPQSHVRTVRSGSESLTEQILALSTDRERVVAIA